MNKKQKLPYPIRFSIKIITLALVIFLILKFVCGVYPLHGNFMFPMMKDGDLAITLKITDYQNGDVVTYQREGVRYFGRIVALEGDEVEISGTLKVNGLIPAEEVFYATTSESEINTVVEEGSVFVLCDYRDDTSDSRTFGSISLDELDGKVIFLFRWRNL